jgi:hypothetical protein
VEKVAKLTAELGGEHIVVIPELWRSDTTGQALEPRTLDDEQWARMAAGTTVLGKALYEEFGLHQQFHSHADSHVARIRRSSASSNSPMSATRTSASTPDTSPITAGTTWDSSPTIPRGSATCTSSRSIRS